MMFELTKQFFRVLAGAVAISEYHTAALHGGYTIAGTEAYDVFVVKTNLDRIIFLEEPRTLSPTESEFDAGDVVFRKSEGVAVLFSASIRSVFMRSAVGRAAYRALHPAKAAVIIEGVKLRFLPGGKALFEVGCTFLGVVSVHLHNLGFGEFYTVFPLAVFELCGEARAQHFGQRLLALKAALTAVNYDAVGYR